MMEVIRQAALQLVNSQLKLKTLLNEISKYSHEATGPNVTAGAVTKDTLQHWSDVTSQPISLVASCYALEQLKLLSEHSGVEGGKSARHFIAEQKLEGVSLIPLEAFWMLFSARLIMFDDLSYTSSEVADSFWSWLVDSLEVVTTDCPAHCTNKQKEIVQGISVVLLGLTYHQEDGQYTQASMDCLHLLIMRSHDTRNDEGNCNMYSVISALRHSHLTHPQHLRQLIMQVMRNLFCSGQEMTLLEAFSLQELWRFARLPNNVVGFYTEVCEVLEVSDCGNLLSITTSRDKVVWQNVLEFISCVITLKTVIVDELLKDLIKDQVTTAMADSNSQLFYSSLLLARQCSMEGAHLFPTYQHWLQEVIGDTINNAITVPKKSVQFLVKCFTDLIPHETSSYLKVHVKFLRKYLLKHKSLVDQYIMVALTRLKDLGVVDGDLLERQGSEIGQEGESDNVEQALKQFEQCREIPPFVMRMSILHPQRFTNSFLPAVLTPRPRSQTLDIREEFILALNRMKKIPSGMMSYYEEECRKQKDGGSSLDQTSCSLGDDNSIMTTLRHFTDCVKQNLTGNIAPSLSVLSNAITTTCRRHDDDDAHLMDQSELLDLNHPSLCVWQVELLDKIISSLCSVVVDLCNELTHGPSQQLLQMRFHWLDSFLNMFSAHTSLHRCLFVRLWELLYLQGSDLSEYHITGLAVLLVHMITSQCIYHQLVVTRPQSVTCVSQGTCCVKRLAQYGEHLLEYLRVDSQDWMCNSLSLLCQMLRHATITKSKLPQVTLVKFQYLQSWLSFHYKTGSTTHHNSAPVKKSRTTVSDVLQLADTVLQEPSVKDQINDNKLSLKEWLSYELSHSFSDNTIKYQQLTVSSSQRYSYRCHMLQEHFVDQSGSCDHREVFTSLLTTLVELNHQTDWVNQSWEDGVGLLQDQVLSLPECSDDEQYLVVPSAIKTALHNKGMSNNEQERRKHHVTVWCCFRIVSMLPNHLFFSNGLSQAPSDLHQSFTILHCYWAPHVCQHYILPFDMTRYLFKSLQTVIRSSCIKDDDITTTLLDSSPLLFSSFVVWWSQLKHIRSLDNNLTSSIKSLALILDMSSSSPVMDLPTSHHLPMITGVCMFHKLMSEGVNDNFLYKLNDLFEDVQYTKQTLIVLLYCVIYQFGWCKDDEKSTLHLIEILIYTDPELLCPLFDCENDCLKDDYLKKFEEYFPTEENVKDTTLFVMFFRLMSLFKSSLLSKVLQYQKVFTLTLVMYDRYMNYKNRCDDNNWVLSLNDILMVSSIFQNIIQLLPDHLLMETTSTSHVSEKIKTYCRKEMKIRNL
ncbi:Fanconi anemia group A protein homolog isoform X2 [Dysidea avara]|uniref:Fanconi anemia group A protein homolog isoform X2 n=1 Tax=Dysidea avara TaxID=196820 RepID=UPI003325DA7E